MNNPEKNQNDYSFILQQQAEKKPGPSRKKVITIVTLVVLLIISLIVGFVISSRRNVVSEQTQTVVNEQATIDVIEGFLLLVSEEKDEEAALLLSSNSLIESDAFIDDTAPFLRTLDLENCSPTESLEALLDDEGRVIRTYECKTKDDQTPIQIEFLLEQQGEDLSIYVFYLMDIAS